MADNRKINSGVWVNPEKGSTDQPRFITDVDELAEVLTPEMQKRLEESGAIEGDWKTKKAKAKDKE
jgi:hypothetical protein